MRIAVVSDIHGNRTAFEAVLADLRVTAPDLIFHGGDLADGGSSPTEIVDRIRDLGWQGVVGNTDEMLFRPKSLTEFARSSPQLQPLWTAIEEMAQASRETLGDERIAWLAGLPRLQIHGPMALAHAGPEGPWRAPAHTASDADLEAVYGPLGRPVVVFGHIHRAYTRSVSGMIVANSGSVSLSYDGDPRASYLLLDDSRPSIRRVEYDVDREIRALYGFGLPHSDWVARILQSAAPQMPKTSSEGITGTCATQRTERLTTGCSKALPLDPLSPSRHTAMIRRTTKMPRKNALIQLPTLYMQNQRER